MKILILCIFAGLTVGCASVHHSEMAQPRVPKDPNRTAHEMKNLDFSAEARSDLSNEHFIFVEFSLENRGNNWLRVSEFKVDFMNDTFNNELKIVSGSDLLDWKEGIQNKKKIEDHNTALFLSSIALAGSLTAGVSQNSTAQAVGGIAALGAIGALTVHALNEAQDKANYAEIFPKSHILHGKVNLPPELFHRKWMLIYSENTKLLSELNEMTFILKNKEGKQMAFYLPISNPVPIRRNQY